MPLSGNMYYNDPTIGRVAGNLGKAIFGDPEARQKRGLYDAEIAHYGAENSKLGEETRGLRGKNDANDRLPGAFANLYKGVPGFDAASAADIARAGGGNADQLTQGITNMLSQLYGIQPSDADKFTSLVLGGKMPDQNTAVSPTQGNAVAGRNSRLKTAEDVARENVIQGGAMSREIYGQGQQNSRAQLEETGRNDRFFATPLNAGANDTIFIAPNDPRRSTMGAELHGVATDTGANRQPSLVNNDAVDGIEALALQSVPGATTTLQNGKPAVVADFFKTTDPDGTKTTRARHALADTYQRTRNAQAAAEAYLAAFGAPPGTTYSPGGWFTGAHMNQPAGQPAAQPQASTAIPPPQQRKPGQVYQTPKGPLTWTGTGWR